MSLTLPLLLLIPLEFVVLHSRYTTTIFVLFMQHKSNCDGHYALY